MPFIFRCISPPRQTNASALSGETGKPGMKSQLCERCDVILCEQDMKNGNAGGASNSSHPKHDSNRKSTLHAFRKFTAAKENVFRLRMLVGLM